MPRKKTSPPPLDEVIELSSGLVIEIGSVEAHAHRSTTRGRSQVIKCRNKTDRILELVFNDYFVITGKGTEGNCYGRYRPPRKNDYLRSGLAFAKYLEGHEDFTPEDKNDVTEYAESWRRKHYPEIKRHIEALRDTLEQLHDNK